MSHVLRKTLFMPYANNKGADQSAHAHSLISAIVVHCLDSIILILAKCKISKKLIEKSRECHTHKPQPTPDTKRKRKMTETNTYKTNVQQAHRPAPSSTSEVITMLKGMTKHEDKEHRKTLKHEACVVYTTKPHRIKSNIRTTALERSVP